MASLLAAACGVAADYGAVRREADSRTPESVALEAALADRDPHLRAEAVAAMGRTGSKPYAPRLRSALRDADARVRYQAAFALGQLWIEEPAPAAAEIVADVIPVLLDPSPEVRAAAVEALGKMGPPELEPQLSVLLSDPQAPVRREAATALFRLRYEGRLASYSSATVRALTQAFADPDAETRWRAAHAFSRWPEPAAAKALEGAAHDEAPTVRLFALRGLAQIGKGIDAEDIRVGLEDPVERVRTEAAGLAQSAARADALMPRVARDPSIHVRAAAARALANPEGDLALLDRLLEDASPFVRSEAILAQAKRRGAAFEKPLRRFTRDADAGVRASACQAASDLGTVGEAILEDCLRDADARVKASALSALAKRPGNDADVLLNVALSDPASPMEVRGAAMEAVSERTTPDLIVGVEKAYDQSRAGGEEELRQEAVEAAEHLAQRAPADPRIVAFRQRLLQDPSVRVRAKAARSLKMATPPAPASGSPAEFLRETPPPGALVALQTDKGVILLELASELAPTHAASFLKLVDRGFYDGLAFHRVVSNFVVQGGDPRGSGWGDAGYTLRDEIGPLKFARGTVGLATAGPDTGSCQFFIALVPAPHLDGRYTAFARVVAGMDVVDRLEPGDIIRSARALRRKAP